MIDILTKQQTQEYVESIKLEFEEKCHSFNIEIHMITGYSWMPNTPTVSTLPKAIWRSDIHELQQLILKLIEYNVSTHYLRQQLRIINKKSRDKIVSEIRSDVRDLFFSTKIGIW